MKPLIVFFYIIIAALILSMCTTQQPAQGANATPTPAALPSSTTLPTKAPTQTSLPATTTAQPLPQAIVNVKEFLARELGIPAGKIKVVSFTAVQWPDSCLGVSTPGIMCAQIITSGYLIVLEADGVQYNYHTDLTGENLILAP